MNILRSTTDRLLDGIKHLLAIFPTLFVMSCAEPFDVLMVGKGPHEDHYPLSSLLEWDQEPQAFSVQKSMNLEPFFEVELSGSDPDPNDTSKLSVSLVQDQILGGRMDFQRSEMRSGKKFFIYRYTPFAARSGDSFEYFVTDSLGKSSKKALVKLTLSPFAGIKPALAVRASGCIMCHAKVDSDVVTDWGWDSLNQKPEFDQYLADHIFNRNIYGDDYPNFNWQTASVKGSIIAPESAKIPLPSEVKPSENSTLTTTLNTWSGKLITEYLSAKVASRNYTDEEGRTITPIKPKSVLGAKVLRIGSPSEAQISALLNDVPKQKNSQVWNYKKSREDSLVDTPRLSTGPIADSAVLELTGSFFCTGDFVVQVPLVLRNLKIATDFQGCRIYAKATVYIEGHLEVKNVVKSQNNDLISESLLGDQQSNNIQISSARAIILGVGIGPYWYWDGSIQQYASYEREYLSTRIDSTSSFTRKAPNASLISAESSAIKSDLSSVVRNDAGERAPCQKPGGGQTLCLPEKAKIEFQRLLLNAPHVHSRYAGDFSGVIIAEIAVGRLASFTYRFDQVFSNPDVPILPLLNINEILKIEL